MTDNSGSVRSQIADVDAAAMEFARASNPLDAIDAGLARLGKRRLARLTGGKSFLPDAHAEIAQACRKIAADIRVHYTIGYSPSNRNFDGTYRRIQVAAIHPAGVRLSVRTRQGYLASPR